MGWIQDLNKNIPDPGVKKAPESGSLTPVLYCTQRISRLGNQCLKKQVTLAKIS
jgi:hypothetical protein